VVCYLSVYYSTPERADHKQRNLNVAGTYRNMRCDERSC